MRLKLVFFLVMAMLLAVSGASAQEESPGFQLLLTPKLLKRLKRDRERATVRWSNFEQRVQTVADSPERGFELGLYYAVTGDEARGKEAIGWALAHGNARQAALVLDWAGELATPDQKRALAQAGPTQTAGVTGLRDRLFRGLVTDSLDPLKTEPLTRSVLDNLRRLDLSDGENLYAAVEYLLTVRAAERSDPRKADPRFFRQLPKELLLSLRPEQAEHPDWKTHAAALALVALDPNLENSQFLQGWASEGQQTIREGPGVAYEFLWADPYLPGISYQNMDPWTYDEAGRLFARANWEPNACWVAIAGGPEKRLGCGAARPLETFGSLHLLAFANCMSVPAQKVNETTIVRKLPPNAAVVFEHDKEKLASRADASGLWVLPNNVAGKVCLAAAGRR